MFRRRKLPNTAAAEWAVKLHSEDLSAPEQDGFRDWVHDPQNANELSVHGTVLNLVEDLPQSQKKDLEGCLTASTSPFATVRRRLFVQPIWLTAVAVSMVLAVVLLAWSGRLGFNVVRPTMEGLSHSYTSNVGEVRTITLPDGSAATLNTQTTLKWVGTDHNRRVQLLRGEALFEVEHDPSRPFQIDLPGGSLIRVLGTRFDVYLKANGKIVVTVINGTVAVEGGKGTLHETLTANQQIEYTTGALVGEVRSTDASRTIQWRKGILEARDQPLSDVASELARYTTKQIVVDPTVASAPISGAFTVRNVSRALSVIEHVAPITVTQTETAYILNHRSDSSAAGEGK